MTAVLTLAEQQALPWADKVFLARRVMRGTWRHLDWDEDDRIAYVQAQLLKLMAGDAAAADQLFQEALLP